MYWRYAKTKKPFSTNFKNLSSNDYVAVSKTFFKKTLNLHFFSELLNDSFLTLWSSILHLVCTLKIGTDIWAG